MNHDYAERIKAVLEYIEENSSRSLSLDELADCCNFSKYHFSRIFSSLVGESPMAYVNQVRLRKSLSLLKETDKTILDISHLCGFESASAFNSAFKKLYNKTPSEVRKSERQNSNISGMLSKKQEELFQPPNYDKEGHTNTFFRRIWDMNVTIKELPGYEVAYVRHVGSYLDTHLAWNALGGWAAEQGLSPMNQYFIGISLDDPGTVPEQECRYDACVTLPTRFSKTGHPEEIRFKELAGGEYALYPFYDTIDKLAIAYQSLFGQWLPDSGYDADDRPCLEFCMNNPAEDKEGKAKVDLYIPIRKRA